MKTQFCKECKHCDLDRLDLFGRGNPCTKGHRPRFYAPKNVDCLYFDNWGWKRKCEDFEWNQK